MADDQAIGVERRTPGRQPEAEMVVIRRFGDWIVVALDDGEELLFHGGELRKALGPDVPPLRAA